MWTREEVRQGGWEARSAGPPPPGTREATSDSDAGSENARRKRGIERAGLLGERATPDQCAALCVHVRRELCLQ